jgi:hypothetical protein
MKHNKHGHDEYHKPSIATAPAGLATPAENDGAFTPSADDVARRAYFTYVDQGCPPGRDVQHWLEAEAELTKERQLTRTHAWSNKI